MLLIILDNHSNKRFDEEKNNEKKNNEKKRRLKSSEYPMFEFSQICIDDAVEF